ncbi:hypothetical protein GRAN_2376 [Granulicella sibirica]|uniref:Uncharacterized protein n=1 Tax=Granulicella sibirica TaxID=2479048 RepID=A0A4Q0T0Y9_9BACT|nr:hypothetical protein GRAN_2376 [Granulicella sibirica]
MFHHCGTLRHSSVRLRRVRGRRGGILGTHRTACDADCRKKNDCEEMVTKRDFHR